MPDALTTHFDLTKPEDGASEDTWGVKLNGDLDDVDDLLYRALTTANYGANTGTADALAVTLDPVLQSLEAGQRVFVKVTADNTAGVTLAVDSTGVKDALNADASAMTAGTLKTGRTYGFFYDGTQYRLMGETKATTAELLLGTSAEKVATPAALAGLNSTSGTTFIAKLPGGYMIQGGTYSGGSANPSITFPVAFNATPRVTLTAVSTGNNTNSSSEAVRLATLASRSSTGFSTYTSGESEVSDVFVGKGIAFDWIAFGTVATS